MRQTFNWGNNWNFSKYIERHKCKETQNSANPRKVNTRKKDLSEWWSNYWKAKEKKILKEAGGGGGNPKYLYMGTMLRMMNDISLQRVENRRQEDSGQLFLRCWKKKKIQSIQNSTSSEKTEQLRDFITNRHELKEMSKEVLH